MDANFAPYRAQDYSYTGDSVPVHVDGAFYMQQRIHQQQLFSPGISGDYGSPIRPAMMPTPRPQQPSPQPCAAGLGPDNAYQPHMVDMIRSASSPVQNRFGLDAPDPSFSGGMGVGCGGLRHDSFSLEPELVSLPNLHVPNRRVRLNSLGVLAPSLSRNLSQLSNPQVALPSPAPRPSPPTHSTQTQPQTSQPKSPSPSNTSQEEIIGYVLADKKVFKCPRKGCMDLKFGRLADLRRHHDQQHARNRPQYFCPYSGCPRSNPIGGGKGRSFGTRKDKRDEHVKNVHHKDNAKSDTNSESQYSSMDSD